MPHVVLLGDSIFDNAAYTVGGPDVVTQLRQLLPGEWSASLVAVDGHRIDDVVRQLARIPTEATHLVLSVGGNDALANIDILERPAVSFAQVLGSLTEIQAEFDRRYRNLVAAVMRREFPLAICTIYDGSFPDRLYQRLASTALCVFNDVIFRVAFERGLTVLDLRLVCDEPADYANPIEPSTIGGGKIARAIAHAVGAMNGSSVQSRVVSGVPQD